MCASKLEDPIYDAQKILWYLTITVTRFIIKKMISSRMINLNH